MNIEQARFNMIEQQIRPWNVLDTHVLELLAVVKREDFVPAAYRAMAFVDTEVPLPTPTGPTQCMLAPKVEARLLQEIDAHKHERVLEIGAGSGYMTALLAHRAQHVTAVEIDAGLVDMARTNLRHAGVMNAKVLHADGSQPLVTEMTFDVIVLSGSVAQIPDFLQARLSVGGRLVAIVGQEPVMCATLVKRTEAQVFERTVLFDTVAPRLRGLKEPSRFTF